MDLSVDWFFGAASGPGNSGYICSLRAFRAGGYFVCVRVRLFLAIFVVVHAGWLGN
jgi:hypothetical protein